MATLFAVPARADQVAPATVEPSGLVLLAIGLAGVVIGRRLSRPPPRD